MGILALRVVQMITRMGYCERARVPSSYEKWAMQFNQTNNNEGNVNNQVDKSVLDGIPVENEAFPLKENRIPPKGGSSIIQPLVAVGKCPKCGAPIYGPKQIHKNETLEVRHSCGCRFEKTIQETLRTT